MNRRTLLAGIAVLPLMTVTANARAWGANGYMTQRVRAARQAGALAFTSGQGIETNPHDLNTSEFSAWAEGYARAAAEAAMTPEEKAALREREEQQRREFAAMIEEQDRAFRTVGIALGGFCVAIVGFCAWVVTSTLQSDKRT